MTGGRGTEFGIGSAECGFGVTWIPAFAGMTGGSGMTGGGWPYPGMTGWGGLPRLPDENRGPRPFRASASSVVERRLGVEALSLRAGGTEFGIGSAKCGFGATWIPAFAGMTGGGRSLELGVRSADLGGGWPYPGMTGGGGGMALPRLPDENRGPRPFRASASSVVDRRLGVEALSLRAGGTEFGIGSAECGIGGTWIPAFAGMTVGTEFGIGSAECGFGATWIPAFAGMTGGGNDGGGMTGGLPRNGGGGGPTPSPR